MRIITLVISLLSAGSVAFAQDGFELSSKKGYSGSVSIIQNVGVSKTSPKTETPLYEEFCGVETVQGYSFGDGWYVGLGARLGTSFYKSDDYGLRLGHFFFARYICQLGDMSPFFGFRVGLDYLNPNYEGYYDYFSSPAVVMSPQLGLAFHRFSIGVAYEINMMKSGARVSVPNTNSRQWVYSEQATHYLSFNFSFHF